MSLFWRFLEWTGVKSPSPKFDVGQRVGICAFGVEGWVIIPCTVITASVYRAKERVLGEVVDAEGQTFLRVQPAGWWYQVADDAALYHEHTLRPIDDDPGSEYQDDVRVDAGRPVIA